MMNFHSPKRVSFVQRMNVASCVACDESGIMSGVVSRGSVYQFECMVKSERTIGLGSRIGFVGRSHRFYVV